MTTWKCAECGMTMKIADHKKPNMCCSCGSKDVRPPDSEARLETYRKYDEELEEITAELNSLYEKEKPLHDRYAEIMQYFRQQKRRGLITEEQYRSRADKYDGLKRRKKECARPEKSTPATPRARAVVEDNDE